MKSGGWIDVKRHSDEYHKSKQACHGVPLEGEHLPPITRQVSNTSSPWKERKVIVGAYSRQLFLIVQLPLPWDLKWFHLIAGPIDSRRRDTQVVLAWGERERKQVGWWWNQFMFRRLARHDLICKQTSTISIMQCQNINCVKFSLKLHVFLPPLNAVLTC